MSWHFDSEKGQEATRLKLVFGFKRYLMLFFLIFIFRVSKICLDLIQNIAKNYVWNYGCAKNHKRHPKWLSKQQKIEQLTLSFYVVSTVLCKSIFPTSRDLQGESSLSERARAHIEICKIFFKILLSTQTRGESGSLWQSSIWLNE